MPATRRDRVSAALVMRFQLITGEMIGKGNCACHSLSSLRVILLVYIVTLISGFRIRVNSLRIYPQFKMCRGTNTKALTSRPPEPVLVGLGSLPDRAGHQTSGVG